MNHICACCKTRGDGSSLPWDFKRTKPSRAWSPLPLSWVGSNLFDLSRFEDVFQVREAEPGVSADRLKKQMPGKCRQQGRMRHSRAFRQKLPPCNHQALLHPCPRAPSLYLQIKQEFSPPFLLQVFLSRSEPTPPLLQLPIAGNIPPPLLVAPSSVCLSAAIGAYLLKPLQPTSQRDEDGFQSVFY